MVFPKKSRWNLSRIIGKDHVSLSWKYDLNPRRKMKDDLFQKNTRKYNIVFRPPEKKIFSRRTAPGYDLSCIIWKDGIFFPKTWYFFSLGRKPATTFRKEYMEIWYFLCTRVGVTNLMSRPPPHPPCQKNSRMSLSRQNTPKGDWSSRLASWKQLQQISVPSQRPLQAFSCIAFQRKKPGNLIYRIEVSLLLQLIRLEIFYNE